MSSLSVWTSPSAPQTPRRSARDMAGVRNYVVWSNDDKHVLVDWIARNGPWFFDGQASNMEKYQVCLDDPANHFSRAYTVDNVKYQYKKLEKEYKDRRAVKKAVMGNGLTDEKRQQDCRLLRRFDFLLSNTFR